MSDQELGKKLVEESQFELFADAYEHATGDRLEIAKFGERPDFICCRADGSACGVELTQVRRDPTTRWADAVFEHRGSMSPDEAQVLIYHRADEKEQKRREPDWVHSDDTILVIQLMDCPLGDIPDAFLDPLCDDLANFGFSEIWIADYTTVEAFREVQLFCVAPNEMRGQYERKHPDHKPFG